MKRRLPTAGILLAAAVLSAVFLGWRAAAEGVVDLSPPLIRQPPMFPRTISAVDVSELRYDLLAERYMLLELRDEASRLNSEAFALNQDVANLWTTWKNYYGLRGGFMTPVAFVELSTGPFAEQEATRFQSELFDLRSRALGAVEEGRVVAAEIEEASERWLALAGMIIDGEGSPSFYAQAIGDLRGNIKPLAGRVSSLELDIRTGQNDFDHLYPWLNRALRQSLSAPPDLARPRHWDYMLAEEPRPYGREDFDRRYAAALRKARRVLDAQRGTAARSAASGKR